MRPPAAIVVAVKQIDQRRLARARDADHRDLRSPGDHAVDGIEQPLRPTLVGERHPFEADLAARSRGKGSRLGGRLHRRRLVEQLAHALDADARAPRRHVDSEQGLHRRRGAREIGGEGDEAAEREAAARDENGARHEHRRRRNRRPPGSEPMPAANWVICMPSRSSRNVAVERREAVRFALLGADRLDELHGAERLDRNAVIAEARRRTARVRSSMRGRMARRNSHLRGQQHQRQQREQRAERDEEDQSAGEHDHRVHRGEQRIDAKRWISATSPSSRARRSPGAVRE